MSLKILEIVAIPLLIFEGLEFQCFTDLCFKRSNFATSVLITTAFRNYFDDYRNLCYTSSDFLKTVEFCGLPYPCFRSLHFIVPVVITGGVSNFF